MVDESLAELHDLPKPSRAKKILYVVSSCIIAFAIGFMLLIIFWLLAPYKTAELEVPVEVLNSKHEISAGEHILMKVKATKYANVTPSRSEFIICDDGSLTFMDPGPSRNLPPGPSRNLPPGTYTIYNDENVLPAKLIPGATCRYHFRYGYKVNPVREIVKEWVSEPFFVVKGDLTDGG